ncbi:hypothetical protein ORI20_24720 [Mycobacterium sp. CVI_P3]|uniref:Uncharacterized protein n=1 Tax=Mycobacterium pinniadriaticum TaxID=2994102 RepID=A0ABT3SLY4_9MYCO|nr:hypothetical protein [Mycobacterium pinniadriaticum]MCX2933481.1 hypothetical protein [Mycobacterium pinniadriaticum]MCX2939880.1 hypothetical protein [Mycobacterium pinniadriaticum]
MVRSCRECAAGLGHCHGTLIRHALHRAECTEDGCDTPELVFHTFVIDCETVGCTCVQQTPDRLAG